MSFEAVTSFLLQDGPASKKIWLEDGQLKKRAPYFTSALVVPMSLTAQMLAKRIAGDLKQTYIRWGVPKCGPVRCYALTSKDATHDVAGAIRHLRKVYSKLSKEGLPTIGLGSFVRPINSAWMAIDVDPQKGNEFTPERAVAILEAVAPGIAAAPRVIFHSSSGWIKNTVTGEIITRQSGLRIVIGVKHGQDIERAGQALFDRLWLAGYGWPVITESGKVDAKTLVDRAVTRNPSQPDFFLPGQLGAGLEYSTPEPTWQDADEGFDTEILLPDVSPEEKKQIEKLMANAFATVTDQAKVIQDKYLDAKAIEAAARSGNSVETERASLKKALNANGQIIWMNSDWQICTRKFGWLTVAQIAEKGLAAFGTDGYCADPSEPEYRSDDGKPTTSKAVIQKASTNGVSIRTFAHNSGTTYQWVAGMDDLGDEDFDAPSPAVTTEWIGTGTNPALWEDTEFAAAGRLAQKLDNADTGIAHNQLTELHAFLNTSNATRGLRHHNANPQFGRLLEQLQKMQNKAIGGHVELVRRDRTNSVVFRYERKEQLSPAVTKEDSSKVILGAIAGKQKTITTIESLSTLPAAIEAIEQAVKTQNTRIEVLVPTDSLRRLVAASLEAKGIAVGIRPARTSQDSAGNYLCSKHKAIILQMDGGIYSQFFSSHCRVKIGPESFEFCPDWTTCGYNQQLRSLDLAQVVLGLNYHVAQEPLRLLELEPAPALLSFGLEAILHPVVFTAARASEKDCFPIAETVKPILDAVTQNLPQEIWKELVSREDMAKLEAYAKPPYITRPSFTPAQAEAACLAKIKSKYKLEKKASPWAISEAILKTLQGKGALGLDRATSQFTYMPVPEYERLRDVEQLAIITPAKFSGTVIAKLSKAMNSNSKEAIVISAIRVANSCIPGTIVLSKYPRARHKDLLEPTMLENLLGMILRGVRAHIRVLVICHSTELKESILGALNESLVEEGFIAVCTPNKPPKNLSTFGFDLIVQTAADPTTLQKQASSVWHRSGDGENFSEVLQTKFPYQAPEAQIWNPGPIASGIVQRVPDDSDTTRLLQAGSYGLVEAAAFASQALGNRPVVIILDSVLPPWPVHVLIPRDRLVLPKREQLIWAEREANPFASLRELSRLLASKYPMTFNSAKAATRAVDEVLGNGLAESGEAILQLWEAKVHPNLEALVARIDAAELKIVRS